MNEYSGLISFRIDWFDLLGVQGTFKTLGVQASVSVMAFSGSMSSRGTVGSYGSSSPNFLRNLHTLLHNACHQFTFPPTVQEGSVSSTSSPVLNILDVLEMLFLTLRKTIDV